jgi:hypothetical protein
MGAGSEGRGAAVGFWAGQLRGICEGWPSTKTLAQARASITWIAARGTRAPGFTGTYLVAATGNATSNGGGVHRFVHETRCDRAECLRQPSAPRDAAKQPTRPGGVPETGRDIGDLRRAAHNPATTRHGRLTPTTDTNRVGSHDPLSDVCALFSQVEDSIGQLCGIF